MRPLLLLALALAACGEPPAREAAPAAEAPPAEPSPVAAGPTGFVGRWAADPAGCGNAPYVFTRTAVETPDGTFCSFQRAAETADGWAVEALCGTERAGSPARLTIERIGDGLRLRVTGREPVTLRRCPEDRAASVPTPDPDGPLQRAAAIDARIEAKGSRVRAYEFKHQGVIHEAWRENDQVLKIVEKVADASAAPTGEQVVWWFAPGAEAPFLVRQPDADFAFDRGRLVARYDAAGRAVTGAPGRELASHEARLLARGRALRLAADG